MRSAECPKLEPHNERSAGRPRPAAGPGNRQSWSSPDRSAAGLALRAGTARAPLCSVRWQAHFEAEALRAEGIQNRVTSAATMELGSWGGGQHSSVRIFGFRVPVADSTGSLISAHPCPFVAPQTPGANGPVPDAIALPFFVNQGVVIEYHRRA